MECIHLYSILQHKPKSKKDQAEGSSLWRDVIDGENLRIATTGKVLKLIIWCNTQHHPLYQLNTPDARFKITKHPVVDFVQGFFRYQIQGKIYRNVSKIFNTRFIITVGNVTVETVRFGGDNSGPKNRRSSQNVKSRTSEKQSKRSTSQEPRNNRDNDSDPVLQQDNGDHHPNFIPPDYVHNGGDNSPKLNSECQTNTLQSFVPFDDDDLFFSSLFASPAREDNPEESVTDTASISVPSPRSYEVESVPMINMHSSSLNLLRHSSEKDYVMRLSPMQAPMGGCQNTQSMGFLDTDMIEYPFLNPPTPILNIPQNITYDSPFNIPYQYHLNDHDVIINLPLIEPEEEVSTNTVSGTVTVSKKRKLYQHCGETTFLEITDTPLYGNEQDDPGIQFGREIIITYMQECRKDIREDIANAANLVKQKISMKYYWKDNDQDNSILSGAEKILLFLANNIKKTYPEKVYEVDGVYSCDYEEFVPILLGSQTELERHQKYTEISDNELLSVIVEKKEFESPKMSEIRLDNKNRSWIKVGCLISIPLLFGLIYNLLPII